MEKAGIFKFNIEYLSLIRKELNCTEQGNRSGIKSFGIRITINAMRLDKESILEIFTITCT